MSFVFDFLFGGSQEAPAPTVTEGYKFPEEYLLPLLEALGPLLTGNLAATGGAGAPGAAAGLNAFDILAGNMLLGLLPAGAQGPAMGLLNNPLLSGLGMLPATTSTAAEGEGSSPAPEEGAATSTGNLILDWLQANWGDRKLMAGTGEGGGGGGMFENLITNLANDPTQSALSALQTPGGAGGGTATSTTPDLGGLAGMFSPMAFTSGIPFINELFETLTSQ
ncbi:MAG: hypothetical protein ACXABY_12945, partial [Candidatus Thorarchaeota archaeon]